MIDILKRYVDTGILLPRHQVEKLLNNRSLLMTYLRKRTIAVKQMGPKFSNYEINTIGFGIKNNMFKPEMINSFLEVESSVIKYIDNPSENVQRYVVGNDPKSIKYIKKPLKQIQLIAVKKDGTAIEFIDNPSEPVQLAAVEESGNAIKYIKKPSERVQLAAVKENPSSIKFIENPHPSVIKYLKSLK